MTSKKKRAPGAGRPAKVQGFVVLTVRMPPESLGELRLRAALGGVSMSDLARDVLVEWTSRQPARTSVKRLVAATSEQTKRKSR
jgi:hypothetical protein